MAPYRPPGTPREIHRPPGTFTPGAKYCEGLTKAGIPCHMPARKGEDFCGNHHPDPEIRAWQQRKSGLSPGKPRVKRFTELQREVVESALQEFMRPYMETLGLKINFDEEGAASVERLPGGGAKVVGMSKDGDVNLSDVEDLGAQVKAVESMMDRIYGKARQSHEVTGAGGGPVEVSVPQSMDRAAQVAKVLAEAGAYTLPAEDVEELGEKEIEKSTTQDRDRD